MVKHEDISGKYQAASVDARKAKEERDAKQEEERSAQTAGIGIGAGKGGKAAATSGDGQPLQPPQPTAQPAQFNPEDAVAGMEGWMQTMYAGLQRNAGVRKKTGDDAKDAEQKARDKDLQDRLTAEEKAFKEAIEKCKACADACLKRKVDAMPPAAPVGGDGNAGGPPERESWS